MEKINGAKTGDVVVTLRFVAKRSEGTAEAAVDAYRDELARRLAYNGETAAGGYSTVLQEYLRLDPEVLSVERYEAPPRYIVTGPDSDGDYALRDSEDKRGWGYMDTELGRRLSSYKADRVLLDELAAVLNKIAEAGGEVRGDDLLFVGF